ncbi:MAG: efflux RND transporter periplasmic adaptor subunit, partial [Terriglobales bacterium]
MTTKVFLTRFRGGVSVAVTVVVLASALVVQHLRHGWPFSLHHGLGPPATSSGSLPPARTDEPSRHARVPVDVEASKAEQLGIRMDTVRREAMTEPVRAIATIALDESRISHVHTRVAGWIEELSVNTTGQYVRRGEPLARIFSQELLSSQTEYLVARRNAASGPASMVIESGRARLKVLGMTEGEIQEIERTGEPMRLVTVVAPRSGVVLHRGISAGTAVDPSTELVTVADLSTVWVLAEVPESDMRGITLGTPAVLDFPALAQPFSARVAFIYPTLTEQTRTLRVRLVVSNPKGVLRPG